MDTDIYKTIDKFEYPPPQSVEKSVIGYTEGFVTTTDYMPTKQIRLSEKNIRSIWEQLKNSDDLKKLFLEHRNDLDPIGIITKGQLIKINDWWGIYVVTAMINKEAYQKISGGELKGFSIALKANVTGEIDRKGSKNPLGIIVEANSYKATELQHIKQTLSDTYDPIINEVHKFSELPPELVVQISLNIDITNIITTIVRNPRESILLASVAVIGKKALELIVEDAYKLMKRSVNNFFSSIRNETPIFVFHTKILGKNITITDSSKNAESVIKNLTLLQGRLQSLSIKDVTKIAEAKRIRINMVGKDSFTLQTDGESIDI